MAIAARQLQLRTVVQRPYINYALRRILTFFAVIWVAASLNFFLPRLASGRDPVRSRLGQQAASGGSISGIQELVDAYSAKFGLDEPLYKQYIYYLRDVVTFDLGYSIAAYPARVSTLIQAALPWTIVLLFTSTIFAFVLGTLAGAYPGW
jgi:peptide/nickel transport system permease protein